jgi:catechol 2,3-dioxygenase-like lactoylglutathione lyase family enzyme
MTHVTPFLRVRNAKASAEFYALLGFRELWEHRFEPGFPLFLAIGSEHGRIFLSEHLGDASPDTLIYLSVPDVDALYESLRAAGIELEPPEEAPWGRELALTDPDGNRLRVGRSDD